MSIGNLQLEVGRGMTSAAAAPVVTGKMEGVLLLGCRVRATRVCLSGNGLRDNIRMTSAREYRVQGIDTDLSSGGLRAGPRGRELAAVRGDGGVQGRGGAVVLALQLLQPRRQLLVPATKVCVVRVLDMRCLT